MMWHLHPRPRPASFCGAADAAPRAYPHNHADAAAEVAKDDRMTRRAARRMKRRAMRACKDAHMEKPAAYRKPGEPHGRKIRLGNNFKVSYGGNPPRMVIPGRGLDHGNENSSS